MLAEKIMVTKITTAHIDDRVCDVLKCMRDAKLRMLPVVDDAGVVVGVVSISGDLNQISYAPDMGILRKHYLEVIEKDLLSVMETKPLFKHEYALVVDEEKHLIGVISAGDILDRLDNIIEGVENDA